MSKRSALTLFVLFSTPLAFAEECQLGGKPLEFSREPIKPGLNGEVICVYRPGKEDQERNVYVYRDGKEVEWRRESASVGLVEHYGFVGLRQERHGERLDYFPGTKQLEKRSRYDYGKELGRQERYFRNGKLQDVSLWVKKGDTTNSTSTVQYNDDGKVTYLACSPEKNENVDAKLCGFEGRVETKGDQRWQTFEKGKLVAEETDYFDKGNSVADYGVTPAEKVKRRRREFLDDGRVRVTDLYDARAKRREAYLDKDGLYTGEDREYFPDGKLARDTLWGTWNDKPMPERSRCLFQNGQDRSRGERRGSLIKVQQNYDDGKKRFAGEYKIDDAVSPSTVVADLFSCNSDFHGLTPNGKYSVWEQNGDLAEEGSFEGGNLATRKRFDKKKLVSDESFYPDGSRKEKGKP